MLCGCALIGLVLLAIATSARGPVTSLGPPSDSIEPSSEYPGTLAAPKDWLTLESSYFGYLLSYPPTMVVTYEEQFARRPEEAGDLDFSDAATTFHIDLGTSVSTLRSMGMRGTDADILREYATLEWELNRGTYAVSELRFLTLGGVPAFSYDVDRGHADLIEYGDGTNWIGDATFDPLRTRLITLCRRGSDGLLYIIRLLYSRTSTDAMAMASSFRCPLVDADASTTTRGL